MAVTDSGATRPPRVVIIGGGFGGLSAAKELKGAPCRVTLVDGRNHHLFQPLLYQVATAALSPADIAQPIRSVLRSQRNCTVRLGIARRIDRERRTVVLEDGELPYDHLVVAAGSRTGYFGNDHWERYAPGLKSLEDATRIRRHILLAFERAEICDDPDERAALLTFVVIGGGPTGVELAGALSEIARRAMARDFRRIDPAQARVVLVEGDDRLLPAMPEELSAKARSQLEELRVEVLLGNLADEIDGDGVTVGGRRIPARTVLWAAGVAPSPLVEAMDVEPGPQGRIRVDDRLRLPDDERVRVVGDLAYVEQDDGTPVPGVAPAAMQEGRYVGRSLARELRGRPTPPFRYRDKGDLATIGRARAVADLRRIRFSGRPAWWLWLVVHIAFLVNLRSKLFVLMGWAWSYLTNRRGARLIVGRDRDHPAADPARDQEAG